MNEVKARYRNKLSKIIIEVWNGQKWLYVKTLSDPLKEFKAECLAKVSLNEGENTEKSSQKCVYGLLSEPVKQDTKIDLVEDMISHAKVMGGKI